MGALKGATLVLRFLLELCALAAVAYWGSRVSSTIAVNVVVGVAAPLLLAAVWGLFLAPKSSRHPDPPGRWLLELLVLAAAVAALAASDLAFLAALLGVVAILDGMLLQIWGLDVDPAG